MDPSGGSMENSMQFGLSSIFVMLGADFANSALHNPLERQELGGAIQSRRYNNTRASPSRKIEKLAYLNSTNPRRYADIRAKYAGLRGTMRAIGWGYLAMGFAYVAEAAFTPGLTTGAKLEEDRSMGMGAPLDSAQAYTQRGRALQAIHESQLGLRNVIGQEASFFHH